MNRFVAGLVDQEIQRDLMKKDNLTLAVAIKEVTDHERAMQTQAGFATPLVDRVSAYKQG